MADFKLAYKRAQAHTGQFNQGKLAKKIGISYSALTAMLHRNSPTLSKAEEIARKGFDMPVSEFIKLGE